MSLLWNLWKTGATLFSSAGQTVDARLRLNVFTNSERLRTEAAIWNTTLSKYETFERKCFMVTRSFSVNTTGRMHGRRCSYGPVRFRQQNHSVRIRRRLRVLLFCSHKHLLIVPRSFLKMSRGVTVSNWAHRLGGLLTCRWPRNVNTMCHVS